MHRLPVKKRGFFAGFAMYMSYRDALAVASQHTASRPYLLYPLYGYVSSPGLIFVQMCA
jgi:hypothetical protein